MLPQGTPYIPDEKMIRKLSSETRKSIISNWKSALIIIIMLQLKERKFLKMLWVTDQQSCKVYCAIYLNEQQMRD